MHQEKSTYNRTPRCALKFLLATILILFNLILSAQYSETFSVDNKGILAGSCTGSDGSTCASIDFTGVDWTMSGNLTGLDATDDYFKTIGGVLTGIDLDEEVCWVSPLLDISTAGNDVDFSVDIYYESLESTNPDYVKVQYSLDGGAFITIDSLFGTGPVNTTSGVSGGLSGNTLQIKLCADVNSGTSDFFSFDNLDVPDNGVTIYSVCVDAAPPTISCPSPQQVTVDNNCNYQVADFTGLATTTDDCGPVTVTQNPTAGQTFNGVGSTVVVLTATDGANNTATCNMSLILVDQSAPSITCPGTQNRNANATCTYSLEDFTSSATVTDNCDASPSVSQSPTAGTTLSIGTTIVTLTATDNSGNLSSCTFNVTVSDNTPPTAICQNGTVQLDASGNGSIMSSDLDGGSYDNCSGSLSYIPTSFAFTCSNVGPNTVTVSVIDASFNSTFCTAVVTVQDNIPPTAVCQDVTLQLSGSSASLSASLVDGGSTDNCPPVARSVIPNIFTCSDIGPNTVTLLAVETSGGTGFSTCTAVVTVEDNTAPIALCKDVTIDLGQTLLASDVDNGSYDECANMVSLSVSPNTFGCANVGLNFVTLTVDDTHGNTTVCTAAVTVVNNIPPTVVCSDVTVDLDGGGNVSITSSDIDGGSSSFCNTVTLVANPNSFNCDDIGPNTVTLTGTDTGNGLSSTCTATVTVADPLAACCAGPVANCNNLTLDLNAMGSLSVSASQVGAGSTADCGLQSESVVPNTFDCMNIGPNTVTYTIMDINGATSSCTAIITVQDNTPPMASCQDITLQLNVNGEANATTAAVENGSTDNCGTINLQSLSPNQFDCSDVGNNVVTLTINDGNGNTAICTSTVTIEDNIPPMASCQDISVYLDASGNTSITSNDVDNGSTDACGIDNRSLDQSNFACLDVGPNTVMLTVTDNNDNESTCTSTVTVFDTVSPIALCQNITIYLDELGDVEIAPGDVDNGSTDACGLANLSLDQTSFTCADVGLNMVTLTVIDNNTNESSCTAMVTVLDTVSPIVVCQNIITYLDATGNVAIIPDHVDGGSSDACGVASLIIDDDSFLCSDIGPNLVILTVEDNNGNTATCTSTVSVVDTTSPVAICQDISVNLNLDGTVTITPEMIDDGSYDNCTVESLSLDKTLFTCDDIGMNVVVLTVEDQSGNTDTCHATVDVGAIIINSVPEIIGMSTICPGLSGIPYDISPDPDITNYQWSYSGSGVTINNNGSTNITIDFSQSATPGVLTVEYFTVCGKSDVKDQYPIAIGSSFLCSQVNDCMNENLFVLNTMIGFPGTLNLFKASNNVSSIANIPPGETVLFRAGQDIDLLPFFEVEQGALFLAEIEGCFDLLKPESVKRNK